MRLHFIGIVDNYDIDVQFQILIILQEIKYSRQYIFHQVFFTKLILIPITISIVLLFRLFQAYVVNLITISDIVITRDEYGYPTDIYRTCIYRAYDQIPIYSFLLPIFVVITLACSLSLRQNILLQSTNNVSSSTQIEELSSQREEVIQDNETNMYVRHVNESKVIFHFILTNFCSITIIFIHHFFTRETSVESYEISYCVRQTLLSSSNLVMIVFPYYLSSRNNA